jgi:hypothetical protein
MWFSVQALSLKITTTTRVCWCRLPEILNYIYYTYLDKTELIRDSLLPQARLVAEICVSLLHSITT